MLKKYAVLTSLIFPVLAFGATPIDLKHQPLSSLQNFTNKTLLGASPQPTLKEIAQNKDFNHTSHIRYQEFFSGYPVWGGEALVHTPQTKLFALNALPPQSSMNGIVYQDLQKDLNNAPPYIFSKTQSDKALQHAVELANAKNVESEKTNIMIYVDDQNKAHWAYYVEFRSESPGERPTKPTFILDAHTFTVYKKWDNIKTWDAIEGGGNGGNFKIGILNYDGLSTHLSKLDMQRDPITQTCYLQNDQVSVVNASDQDQSIRFSCKKPDSNHNAVYWNGMSDFANFGFSPGNDALYAGKIIKAMYQEWYNTPVLTEDGHPLLLKMRVHDRSFMGIENAYWDGDKKAMTFGDGLLTFYPLVSLGIGAHEISHGFTEQHSNLVYEDQSGGLNEAYSDMAAEAAEFYSKGSASWQIGSEVMKAKDQALRYMDEPTKDCKGKQPGTLCSISNANDYKSTLDVHFTSGVFNKAYYLISTAPDWNVRKSFNIMVQANMNYWTATTTFVDAACGVLKATHDYKYDVGVVKHAFDQVGIDTSVC